MAVQYYCKRAQTRIEICLALYHSARFAKSIRAFTYLLHLAPIHVGASFFNNRKVPDNTVLKSALLSSHYNGSKYSSHV